MLLIIIFASILYKFTYQLRTNNGRFHIPKSIDFKKGDNYSIQIKSNEINSIYIQLEAEKNTKEIKIKNFCENQKNINSSENVHNVHFHNGEGTIFGNIKKDGRYKAILNVCEVNNDNLTIEITITNLETKPKIQNQECYRIIISIVCLMSLFNILWFINWIKYFTIKNGIHLLLTLSFILLLTEKIIHIIDYKARYELDKIYTITKVRCIFIVISRFSFFMANFLLINGFEINYSKPNFWFFLVSFILASSYTVISIYNNKIYNLTFFIGNFFIGAIFIFYVQQKQKKSDTSTVLQFVGTLFFFIYSFFYFLSYSYIYTENKVFNDQQYKKFLILNILQVLVSVVIGLCYKMTNETKKDYRFYFVYSICNYEDFDDLSENTETSNFVALKDCAFNNCDFHSFTILDNVISIGDYAFENSKKLKVVNFSNPSNVRKIGKNAFNNSAIQDITIPSTVEKIDQGAFANCFNLNSVNFQVQSKLTTIEKNMFNNSTINSLYIPSKVEKLKESWCSNTPNLKNIIVDVYNSYFIYYNYEFILGKINLNYENYEILYFARRDIEIAEIPFYVKLIASNAFENCYNLQKVESSPYSQLNLIDKYAFKDSSINEIAIPSTVKIICRSAFENTTRLKNITFSDDSKLVIIDEYAFQNSSIDKIVIPSQVTQINESAFSNCEKMKYAVFDIASNLKTIEKYAFNQSSIISFAVPPSIIEIKERAFQNCNNLLYFEINDDSQLLYFDINWFINSPSVSIFIPSKLMEFFNYSGK